VSLYLKLAIKTELWIY